MAQLGVFGFGLDEDGDAGVGVLPEGEEVLIGAAGVGKSGGGVGTMGGLGFEGEGAGDLEMGECADGFIEHDAGVIEDFLELRSGGRAIVRGEICLTPNIARVKGGDDHWTRRAEFVGRRGLKGFNCFRRIALVERDFGANFGEVIEFRERVFGELLGEVVGEGLAMGYVAAEGIRQGRSRIGCAPKKLARLRQASRIRGVSRIHISSIVFTKSLRK